MPNIERKHWGLDSLEFIENLSKSLSYCVPSVPEINLNSFNNKIVLSELFANLELGSFFGESRSVILFEKVNDYVILHHKEMADYD